MLNYSPRERAAHYIAQPPPALAISIPSPWWWAVLGLDCGMINVGSAVVVPPGPVAIVAAASRPRDNLADQNAIAAILKAEGRPTFDAYWQPWSRLSAAQRFVGVCTVTGEVGDSDAKGLWFDGPRGIVVTEPLLFRAPYKADLRHARGDEVIPLDDRARSLITDALRDRATRA